ncbi:MAG: ABC transporter substrate-binding protein [Anaerolineae bacterium]
MRKISLLFAALAIGAVGFSSVSAQDNIIKIASQSPLSGPQSALGIGIRNGTELAIRQLSGPIEALGFTIQYVPFDDQALPDIGVANAQQIIADAAILGVIGHLNSGVAIPSSEVYVTADLVMISPSNTNPVVTDRGLPTVNRICGRDDFQGPTAAQFAFDRGVTSVFILDDTTAYGVGLADFFEQKAIELGIEVLGRQGTAETANFDSIITPILALNPDAIFFGGIFNQTGVFINQARAAGFEGLYLSGDGSDSTEFAALAGEAGIGTFLTSTAGPASLFPNAAQFIADYTEAFGGPPITYATEAYDATAVLLLAIEQAIKDAGGMMPTRAAVAAAVRAVEYEGLTGPISFDANGDRTFATYYVLEVRSGDPATYDETKEVIAIVELPSPLTAAESEPASIASIVADAASGDEPEFTLLLTVVSAADPAILEALADPDSNITVFAPTDAAFLAAIEALGGDAAALLADTELLTNVLLYHVVEGSVFSSDLSTMMVPTLLGPELSIEVTESGVTVNGANVVVADIEASNGVIHVIDAVLLPPTE